MSGKHDEPKPERKTLNLLDTSSLVDLKAELFKKREAARYSKANVDEPTTRHPIRFKGEVVKKEKGCKNQQQTSDCGSNDSIDDEEALALQKSRLALESKAKLYQRILEKKSLSDENEYENFLVNFDKKIINNDGKYLQQEKNESVSNSNYDRGAKFADNIQYDLTNESEKKKDLSKSATFVDNIQEDKEYTHYEDVRFNEVREHGVGFFSFSQDEEKRKEQMDSLNNLHDQTKKNRMQYSKTAEKRKAVLEARLATICKRRNIDESVVSHYTKKTDSESNDSHSLTEASVTVVDSVELSSIPLPEETKTPEPATKPIRPWDIGKNSSAKRKEGANEWIESRRSERQEEFAPPSAYDNWR